MHALTLLTLMILLPQQGFLPKPDWAKLPSKPGDADRAVAGPIHTTRLPEVASLITQPEDGKTKVIGSQRRLSFRQWFVKDVYIAKSGKWIYSQSRHVYRAGSTVIMVLEGKEDRKTEWVEWLAFPVRPAGR